MEENLEAIWDSGLGFWIGLIVGNSTEFAEQGMENQMLAQLNSH